MRFFFIPAVVIYLVQAESALFATTDFTYNPIRAEIELIVTPEIEYDSSCLGLGTPTKNRVFAPTEIGSPWTHAWSPVQYAAHVLQQVTAFNRAFNPNRCIVAVLHKRNIWHQNSDEDPPIFG